MERELSTDVLIVGGGTGGFAAALALGSLGVRCIITEPTDWLGGQLTSQAVPPDENQWIETVGGTASYQHFRSRVRAWYREHRSLVPSAHSNQHLNPGGGWVSRLCCEPRIAHAVLLDMLKPHVDAGLVQVKFGQTPTSVDVHRDHLRSVRFAPSDLTITARCVLDATELGDLLALANIEHMIGAEHQQVFGELHGRADRTDLLDQQAVSWCFAIEHRPGEHCVIDRPASYDFWRNYTPVMTDGTSWTGPLFSWTVPSHNPEGRRTFRLVPWPDEPAANEWEMWRYRRIVDRGLHAGDARTPPQPDVALINMVQMDYWQKPLLGVSAEQQAIALAEAREQSRAWLYWMQTEAPRHDSDKLGYPGLKLRGDELGTSEGLAKACYIREARRLVARTIVTEAHIGTQQRRAAGLATSAHNWDATPFGTSEQFSDSVGIGHYMIDLHPSTAGRNNVYVPSAPFRIPMGALVPARARNLLAAGKCLGVTHVTNGCYRMHHVEWNIGEAAGALAAMCLRTGLEPAAIHADSARVGDVQQTLAHLGVRMKWPWE
jgi:FAD dependent oxidoreductase